MSVMNVLIQKLDKDNIPYEVTKDWRNLSIKYPKNKDYVCSIIFFDGSYGFDENLLEISGLLTDTEKLMDDVAGYLTAGEVFNRIESHYNNLKEIKCLKSM